MKGYKVNWPALIAVVVIIGAIAIFSPLAAITVFVLGACALTLGSAFPSSWRGRAVDERTLDRISRGDRR